MKIATVLLLEDMGANYRIVTSFTVEAIPGEDSCLSGRPADGQCCVTRNLSAECQFMINSSYLYGLVIPTELSDGPNMIQTQGSIGRGYQFPSDRYVNRPGEHTLVKFDLGFGSTAPPTPQQVKMFQFIIGKFRINV